jgi:murein DD-endopeptidase MepM/ murein hydrolase activator NlpD
VSDAPAIKPLGEGATAAGAIGGRGSSDPPQGTASATEAQKLARVAAEFESMLLVQMLREMRKSGSWKDEQEGKDGFGAETLFDTLDMELASYITKVQGFGLEKSLVKQITGGGDATSPALPARLPSLDLPPSAVSGTGSLDPASIVGDASAVTSPFGWRRDPFSGAATYHRGVDLRAAYGETVGAADAGTVVFAGEQGGYGQTVVVEHGDGVRTRYAHLSSLTTRVGAEVTAGESIGRAGHSGRATGTHLHFEVTRNGRPVDPQTYSPGGLKPEGVTADWEVGTGPTLPGVPQRGSASE